MSTMCGLTFNGPKKPWPEKECNARRCIKPATYLYKEIDLWPGKHPPRDVVLCQDHATKMQKANERAKLPVPKSTVVQHEALVEVANQTLTAVNESPAALLRQAAITMKAETTEYLSEYERGALDDLGAVADFEIDGDEAVAAASEFLASVKADLKGLEDHRKERAGIFGKVKREIDSWYRGPSEVSKQIKLLLETKLKEHRAAGIARQQELIAAAQDAESPAVVKNALVAASDATQKDVQGMAYIDRWKFEVVDAAAVPREYLCPDLVKITEAVKVSKESTEIPGIRVYNDPIVRNG